MEDIRQLIDEKRRVDLEEKQEMKRTAQEHQTETDRFREVYDMFVYDVTNLSEENCHSDFLKSMKYLLKSRGRTDEPPQNEKSATSSMELERYQKQRD